MPCDPISSPHARFCAGRPHPQAVTGLKLFNQRRYFEAHEAFEAAWRAERGPLRALYQGILQIGVAYHHILRGNYRGGLNLLRRGSAYLEAFKPACKGIQVAGLLADAAAVERALLRCGPAGLTAFDPDLFRAVAYEDPEVKPA